MSDITSSEVKAPKVMTGRSLRENYIVELQSVIHDRVRKYDDSIVSPANMNSMYLHIRAILSLHLKRETGSPIKKGNNVLTKEEYDKCLKYLDMILP